MRPLRRPSLVVAAHAVLGLLAAACAAPDAREARADSAAESPRGDSAGRSASLAPVGALALVAPADSEIPNDALGASMRRGRALVLAPRDSLPGHVGAAMRCTSCHLDGGRRANAGPWVGVYARFPQYRSRTGSVITLEDRVNDCFTRSLNGRPLPPRGSDMRDIVAYLAFLSRGTPIGSTVKGQGIAKLRPLAPDTARGARVYAAACVRCHGDGTSGGVGPPLWGPRSYNIGASMAQLSTAAAFIRHNMPYDRPGTLTDQEAFDVAAYVNAHRRSDLAGKENDWPNGDAPPDVPYRTLGAARAGR